MTDLRHFAEIGAADAELVGGKGLSLGQLANAGLPVPAGFCLTTAAHRRLRGRTLADDPALAEQLAVAYRALGAGPVAVRSSATAEDGAVTNFAGQQETILGVQGLPALLDAIRRCWASLDSDRAKAYRQHQRVAEAGLAMAVVVQRLVPAETAGVLFTRDPLDPSGRRMLVEASWGLGEAVVSGRVVPDRFQLRREDGGVVARQLGGKAVEVTPDGERPVAPERRACFCLDDAQLAELADLGRRVETFFGSPRDVEWARADGRFWLLQARPITAGGAAERQQVGTEERERLRALAAPGGTVWSRDNLSEVLAGPTPLTWGYVRRLLSGSGGFGHMYRDFGFAPDPALAEDGYYDLIAGRPYANLSREPLMQFAGAPFEHPFAALKADPARALEPTPVLTPGRDGFRSWLRLPVVLWRLARAAGRTQKMGPFFEERFRTQVVPPFLRAAAAASAADLSRLGPADLVAEAERWARRALVEFARESLKPTVFARLAVERLKQVLGRRLPPERVRSAVGELTLGARPDPEADLPGAVRDLAAGRLGRGAFLERFGHRGSQEMELAQPRWSEDPSALDRLCPPEGTGVALPDTGPEAWRSAWERVAHEATLPPAVRAAHAAEVSRLHTFLGLRETAKHHLMRGYALIRRPLAELDRRLGLQGGIFYLRPEELPRLVAGEDFGATIAERRKRRTLLLSLEVPPVVFSDDLDAVGRPTAEPVGGDRLEGMPLSAGVAEGPALVLHEPPSSPPTGPYVLVCPSTDPAWVPLFVQARALVMETGGVLSHGAIVAREFGLPAVAGIPGVQDRLRDGQRLRVDGGSGVVIVLE